MIIKDVGLPLPDLMVKINWNRIIYTMLINSTNKKNMVSGNN